MTACATRSTRRPRSTDVTRPTTTSSRSTSSPVDRSPRRRAIRRAGARGARPDASSSRPTTASCTAVDDVSFDVARQRDARHRGRVGLGQERHVAGDPRAAARRRRRSPARCCSGASDLLGAAREASCRRIRGRQHRDGLPGRARRAEPGVQGRRPDRRGDHGAPTTCTRPSCTSRVDRAARPRRHPEPERAGRPVPARVLRRHAPAGDDRHGDRQRPRPAHRRRADHRARRHHPGAGARGARADPGPHRLGDHAHHPRPRRGRRRRRPGARDVRRAAGRDRARSTRSSTSRATRTPQGLLASLPRLDRRADERAGCTASRASRRR